MLTPEVLDHARGRIFWMIWYVEEELLGVVKMIGFVLGRRGVGMLLDVTLCVIFCSGK